MRHFIGNATAAFASIALTAGIVAFADPANASIAGDTAPRAIVRVGDLDLRSDAGRSVAERRIRQAVDSVCGNGDGRDLAHARCRDEAIDAARQALDARIAAL